MGQIFVLTLKKYNTQFYIMKVLVCGHKSLASRGLLEELKKHDGLVIWCFSRGEENRQGNVVTGDVFNMSENRFLEEPFDVVINYILIKKDSIENNINYLKSLIDFCKKRQVKRLIHVSTISVYPNEVSFVDELSPIETDIVKKGVYGALKIKCDEFLTEACVTGPSLSILRPGYIVEEGEQPKFGGIMISLPLNGAFLLGNKRTSLPLIYRSRMNMAIANLIDSNISSGTYLLLDNNKGTKYSFVKQFTKRWVIWPPKNLSIFVAWVLWKFRIFNENKFHLVKGLFKNTVFDSIRTEKLLNVKF